jgi:hypothetical protein
MYLNRQEEALASFNSAIRLKPGYDLAITQRDNMVRGGGGQASRMMLGMKSRRTTSGVGEVRCVRCVTPPDRNRNPTCVRPGRG